VVSNGPRLKSRRKAADVEVSEVAERDVRPWWVRVRSGALLALLLAALGVATAAVIGLFALAMAALIDQALG
jgi:hypothetical protein